VEYQEILNFWFGKSEDINYGKPCQFWFVKSDEFDLKIRSQFSNLYDRAAAGELDNWRQQPCSCLALIIILDQFPRNIFRNSPKAFATDDRALAFAKYAIAQKFDTRLLSVQRWFIYLPFEHSEKLTEQKTSIELFNTLQDCADSKQAIDNAYRHWEIIKRFGRFPHRNQILARASTPEEINFLQQSDSSF
jgi:uncharacterized protein (DUF924 family)